MRYDALIAALLLLAGAPGSYAAAMGRPSWVRDAAAERARDELIATIVAEDLRQARRQLDDLDATSTDGLFESDGTATALDPALGKRDRALARLTDEDALDLIDLLQRARAKKIAPPRPHTQTKDSLRTAEGSLGLIEIAKRAKEKKGTAK